MTVSTIPDVLDDLVQRARLALPKDVEVIDSHPPRDFSKDMVIIGFTGVPFEPAVEVTSTREQLTARPIREQYDIVSLSSAWPGGETDPALPRRRAFEFVDAIADELAKDKTLGKLVMSARISTGALAQAQTDRGAAATVRFVIHIDAFGGR